MPASSARWMMRIESSWSVLPHAPNIIVPRQSGLTLTPVRPRGRYSTRSSLTKGPLDAPQPLLVRAPDLRAGPQKCRVGSAFVHSANQSSGPKAVPIAWRGFNLRRPVLGNGQTMVSAADDQEGLRGKFRTLRIFEFADP